jgi:hypothetical protein
MTDAGEQNQFRMPLDIVAGEPSQPPKGKPCGDATTRPFLMVWFKCAAKYQKVFRSADATSYTARCPTCGRSMQFAVGPDGANRRQFEVSC